MKSKILIIEDNRDMSTLLYHLLPKDIYKVHQCFDGESGMAAISSFQPHVIILDILLPKVDGRDLLDFIQKSDTPPKVIVFSSTGWSEVVADNIYYCPKGIFSIEKIKDLIDEIAQK